VVDRYSRPACILTLCVLLQCGGQTGGSGMEVDAAAPLPEPPVLKRQAEAEEKEDGSPTSKKSVHARPPCPDAMPLRGSQRPGPG
jgi:hypothetical protein